MDRRKFVKAGIASATGVVAASHTLGNGAEKEIITRKFGKTGLELPIVSMGVMNSDNPNLVKAALASGILHIDTAHVYQRGRNEVMLGELIKDYDRDSFVISTKIRPDGVDRNTGLPTDEVTPENFMEKFEISMERLGLEYVDFLYLHAVQAKGMVQHKPISDVMKKLKKEGRVRFIGVSTHKNEPEVIDAMIEDGFWDMVLTAYNFKMDHVAEMNAALERANKAGLGVVAMKTMAGGFLDKEKLKPIDTTAALKWAMNNPNVHTSIPGMTTFDQLEKNITVLTDLKMTGEEKEHLTLASNDTGLFCTGCRECLPACRKSLNIPDYMRAYMYTYGYSNLEKAHTLLSDIGDGANPCGDCTDCTVNCTMKFNVRDKIADVSRLINLPGDMLA